LSDTNVNKARDFAFGKRSVATDYTNYTEKYTAIKIICVICAICGNPSLCVF